VKKIIGPFELDLSEDDRNLAGGDVGVRRQNSARKYKRSGVVDPNIAQNGFWYNINGASGELVVARFAEVPWDGCLGDLGAKDVGNVLQVRTAEGHSWPLRIEEWDNPKDLFVLVTGIGPWRIQGWARGQHAIDHADVWGEGEKKEKLHHYPPPNRSWTHGACYWCEQKHLDRDLGLLKRWVHKEMALLEAKK